ncbi:MAG: ferredoxin [Acidimicrobiales bacterium]|nr:ferredoxin [Acidimicrobiales bacterium]
MKVSVDPWKCQSHLKCVSEAPGVFRYDEERSYSCAIEGEVPTELEDAARRAVSLCPEGAISIE